jgi:L,D-transpeptidase YcbB
MFAMLRFSIAVLALAAPAAAQDQATPAPVAAPLPAPAAAPLAAQPPAQPIAPLVAVPTVAWPREDAEALLAFIGKVGADGLDPADYNPERLRAAIDGGGEELNRIATQTFLKLSSDLMLGHVRGDARVDWHLRDDELNAGEQYALMKRAIEQNSINDTLTSLLPTHPQYIELKAVLAQTPASETETIDKIRVNLDRWRWLPRDLGQRYVIVNVPAYSVALVEDGRVTARRRAVAGAPKTATPQLDATITGVIFNPWWEVPASIAPEVRGKKGYVRVPNGDGFRYRQPPGPSNALGRMKLVMPNPHAIYLHDTNAKGLFDKKMRAYSHGCIRTEDAVGFASILLESNDLWDREKINQTIASGETVQADLAAPVPVYITYFTAAAVADKGEIIAYKDIYGRDDPVEVALNEGAEGTALAAR